MKQHLQLSKPEIEMITEVFNVMSKYPTVDRHFGLQLIHSHFSINEDEILYETHDKESRVLITTPHKISEVVNVAKATAWCQNLDGEIEVAMLCCEFPPPPRRHEIK